MNYSLNPNASAFAYACNNVRNTSREALDRLRRCQISEKDQKKISPVLDEWFSSNTLSSVLVRWEKHGENSRISTDNNSKTLSFILYNVQGLRSRSLEVTELIHQVEASFAICTEVGNLWHTQQIPDFKIYHEKGTNKSGGVIIAVGKHLIASKVETNMANTLVVDIFGLKEPLRVIGIYWPESQKRDINEISAFISKNTIIAGDFNATVKEWNSPKTDKRGEIIKTWSEVNNLRYIHGTTNSSRRSDRNIDLTFTNLQGITGETKDFGTSDHRPLVYQSRTTLVKTTNLFPVTQWKLYELLLCLLQEFWIKQLELQPALDWYKSYIRFLTALKARLTSWHCSEKWRPTLPSEILDKLKNLRKIRNRFRHNHYEEDRIILRLKTREIQREISEYKSGRWNEFLSKIQQNRERSENMFWKQLSTIYKPSSPPFNKLLVKNRLITEPKEIVEELQKYYEHLLSAPTINPTDPHDEQIVKEYEEILGKLKQHHSKIRPTNATEVKRIIQKLKPKKSSGHDSISNFMIKKLPPAYLECLSKCFNELLEEYQFVSEWKLAEIVTLNKLKAGTPTCEQTRPISLLATHSKIYEKILLDRIKEWAETNHIIPDEQSGFRKGCLLQTRVLSIHQEVQNNLAGNIPTLGIYVDYKKAYDLVWHMGLVVKLSRLHMPVELLKLLINWLAERQAYITFDTKKSNIFRTHVGLPQGSSLSPYVFILYHADITQNVEGFSTHLFADDLSTLITPPIQKSCQDMITFINSAGTRICQNLFDYSIKWKQPINISKTVVQIFHSQVKKTRSIDKDE